MKRFLITGGAGFIGSNFIHYLLRRRQDVLLVNLDLLTYAGNPENLKDAEDDPRYVFVRGDVCDRRLVSSLFQAYDFDCVVHFAAESHVDRSLADPGAFVRTNVLGTVNLLERAKEAWSDGGGWKEGRKFLQVSTDEVYGSLGASGFFTEQTPLCPHSPYSASKASADHFVKAFSDSYGMPVCITRCSNNYGPYQHPEKLIPLTILRAMRHQPIPVYGDGLQVRDWLYVTDHCKALELVCSNGKPGEVYNVGGHNEKPNLLIVQAILRRLRERLNDSAISGGLIRHVEDRPGHDRRYGIDPGKITRELGWAPETPFEEGIVRTVDWYLDHREWMDRAVSREPGRLE